MRDPLAWPNVLLYGGCAFVLATILAFGYLLTIEPSVCARTERRWIPDQTDLVLIGGTLYPIPRPGGWETVCTQWTKRRPVAR